MTSLKNKNVKTFGIGAKQAKKNYLFQGLNTRLQFTSIKKEQTTKLNQQIMFLKTGVKLKTEIKEFIEFSVKNRTYKGIRHKLRYPVRGQRTHTNAKTTKKIYLS